MYVFAGKEIAAERLEKVNKLFFPDTKNFFLQTQALEKVSLLVDLGCGPGYTTRALNLHSGEFLTMETFFFYFINLQLSGNKQSNIFHAYGTHYSPF